MYVCMCMIVCSHVCLCGQKPSVGSTLPCVQQTWINIRRRVPALAAQFLGTRTHEQAFAPVVTEGLSPHKVGDEKGSPVSKC